MRSTSATQIYLCFTVAIAIACTVTNTVFFYLRHANQHPGRALLRRPNPFIGLDTLDYGNSAAFDNLNFSTFPTVLQKIDRDRPKFVYPDDPRRKFTQFGTISPEDRHFFVSNSVRPINSLYTAIRLWFLSIYMKGIDSCAVPSS